MKYAIASACLAALALVGCANGQLTPQVSSSVNVGYATACVDSPGQPSLLSAMKAIPLNAQRNADVASLSSICANGAPTSVFAAAGDAAIIAAMIQRDFPTLKVRM